jgi:hypothetical protein
VQATAADGTATFTTVVPGCYPGRVPHIHFEIYRSLAAATATSTSAPKSLRISQLALPTDVCAAVYASASGYSASTAAIKRLSLARDFVFADGASSQLASMTGDIKTGYTARLQVAIAA